MDIQLATLNSFTGPPANLHFVIKHVILLRVGARK